MKHPWYAWLILALATAMVAVAGGYVFWTWRPWAGYIWGSVALGISLAFGLAQLKNR